MEVSVDDYKFVFEDMLAESFESFTIDYSNNWLKKGFSVYPNGSAGSGCS